MSTTDLNHELFEAILTASEMVKRHAEQRYVLLKQLVEAAENSEKSMDQLEKDHEQLAHIIDELQEHAKGSETSEFFKKTKLSYLNSLIQEIDHKEMQKEQLINEIMQLDANLLSRDELVSILSEYIEMEEASIHKMITEYSEAQDYLIDAEERSELYNKLSLKDPRFNALKVINSHPTGISTTQLSYMLGTTPYQAQKIIRELIEIGLIRRHPDSQLIEMVADEVQIDEEMISQLNQY